MSQTDTTTDNTEIDNEPVLQNESSEQENDQATKKKSSKDEITEENCHFQEDEILRFVRVRFPGHAKSFPFLVGKRRLSYGQKVMAMSDRGMAVGYINSFPYELPFKKHMLPIRSINKLASLEDVSIEKENYKRQKEIETICQDLIEKYQLEMNLTHVEFTQFGKKVVFYFVAPARVDFRGLVKDLVTELKLRIELRQISVRDRAASMGALGPCGRELCCSSFLSKYGNVSIKMAKNQNLSLNYSKLNGVCGQLKCCLQYEDEVYGNKRKKLPQEGTCVETKNGDKGLVRKLHILSEQFDMLTDRGLIRRYTSDQYVQKLENYSLPSDMDHIIDETHQIVGLTELDAKNTHTFEKEMEKINQKSKQFASDAWKNFTTEGILPPNHQSEKIEVIKEVSAPITQAGPVKTTYVEYAKSEPSSVSSNTAKIETKSSAVGTQRPQHNNRGNGQRFGHNKNKNRGNQSRD